jgi:hypothetical protein
VKVFVYFSRVEPGAGPFEYLRGSVPGGRYGDLWPWSIRWRYPPEEEVATRIPESAVLTATGETGTVIFCDTSGFHRGGFARTDPRILSVSTYVSPASYIARRNRRFSVDLPADGELSDAAAFALS